MAQTVEQVRELIRMDTAELKQLSDTAEKVMRRRDTRIVRARALGATGPELVADTGMSEGRISQIAPARAAKATRAAKETTPSESAAADSEGEPAAGRMPTPEEELPPRFRPGSSLAIQSLVATLDDGKPLVTDRWSKTQDERPCMFVDTRSGAWSTPDARHGRIEWTRGTVGELLAQIPGPIQRVFLVGPRPGLTPEGLAAAHGRADDALRNWFLGEIPAGWVMSPQGHYLSEEPVGHWERERQEHDGARHVLEVMLADQWFGDGEYSVREAAHAWYLLQRWVAEKFGEDAIMLATPATTGRDLWRRTIGWTKDKKPQVYPVLSDELRGLISSTSGQGRREVLTDGPRRVPGFAQYDMRFAYSALAWGMPVGAPTMVTSQQFAALPEGEQMQMLAKRGRWLVRATVPNGWNGPGILMAPSGPKGWCYPKTPGQSFATWTTGSELMLALHNEWPVSIWEGFYFTEGKPLNTWKDRLTEQYLAWQIPTDAIPAPVARLARAALRSMMLFSLGAFASRTHLVTHTVPNTPAGEKQLPSRAPVRIVGDHWVWEEKAERSGWVARLAHPEWSAEIWGRCRARLLQCPTGTKGVYTGALHVPPGAVLGMRTDALYLGYDPGWKDDGQVGRFRRQAYIDHEIDRPVTDAELSALKRSAQHDE